MNEILVLFGFSWIIIGTLLGLFLAFLHEPHVESLAELAAQGNLLEYHKKLDAFKWKATAHAHGLLFSMICILVGLVMPSMDYSDTTLNILGSLLVFATISWTIFGFLFLKPLLALGDVLFFCAIIMTVIGLL